MGRIYLGSNYNEAYSVIEMIDGGYLIIGKSISSNGYYSSSGIYGDLFGMIFANDTMKTKMHYIIEAKY